MLLSYQSASARGRPEAQPVDRGRRVRDRVCSSAGRGHDASAHASAARLLRAFLPAAAIVIFIVGLASGDTPDREPLLRVLVHWSPSAVSVEPASGRYLIRVEKDGKALTLSPGRGCRIEAAGGAVVGDLDGRRLSGERLLMAPADRDGTIALRDARTTRRLLGGVQITASGGRLRILNLVSLEDYVRTVVPSEMPARFHQQALRAQAIVARTWALRHLGRHAPDGYDFCDSTHCQVYRGADAVSPNTDAAVRATRGLVITCRGELIEPIYHSTCGGHTADSETVWRGGRAEPYLRGVSDRAGERCYCADSPYAWWKCTLTPGQLAQAAGLSAPAGISVSARDAEGRVTKVTLRAGGRERSMTGYEFYLAAARAIGPGRVRSAWFDVRRGDEVALIGRGFGHGVGMCQWGAHGRACAGQTAEQILRHYYGREIQIGPQR